MSIPGRQALTDMVNGRFSFAPRSSHFRQNSIQIIQRIHGLAVDADFKVAVRAGGIAGVARERNPLSL